MDNCLKSVNYVNLVIANKPLAPQWLTMDEAVAHCRAGASIWRWASVDDGVNPDVTLVGIGDNPTLEVLAAAHSLRQDAPELRVRVVKVTDLLVLDDNTLHRAPTCCSISCNMTGRRRRSWRQPSMKRQVYWASAGMAEICAPSRKRWGKAMRGQASLLPSSFTGCAIASGRWRRRWVARTPLCSLGALGNIPRQCATQRVKPWNSWVWR
jgi:hypothetical protein